MLSSSHSRSGSAGERGGCLANWRRTAPAEKIEKSHELGNPAASTAAADAERVYVYFGSYGLLCYDHAGSELWKYPMPTPKTMFGTATSPVLVEGRLVLNYQGAY